MVVGEESREQFLEMTGYLPDTVLASVGGGSNAMGIFSGFLNDPVDLVGVEPLGRGETLGDHAASLTYGKEGILHGFKSILLQNDKGEAAPVHSIASGLDYPGSGPEHAFLLKEGRTRYTAVSDQEAVDAFFKLSKMEGIIPALESAHAVAEAIKMAQSENPPGFILVSLSGRGDKDVDYIMENYPERFE